MQRPIIFLATDDQSFEETAIDVILDTCRGVRRAFGVRGARRILAEDTSDIGLAIVDLDLEDRNFSLLRLLGGSEPAFPILVVGNEQLLRGGGVFAKFAAASIVKPVSSESLRQKIDELGG